MDLSIIIPAFNESQKISRDVEAASTFLKGEDLAGEIIVVDDGSHDDTVAAAKKADLPPDVHLDIIRYDNHRGKGYAVRTGMVASKGEYVMFADSGNCVPYKNALRGLDMLKSGACELAHGSRKLPESSIQQRQAWYRRILSRLFRWVVIRAMKVPAGLTDTQCGFKMYHGDVARTLYGECNTDGFMFDMEIIVRACKANYRIREFPIEWTSDRDSRLSPIRSSLRIMLELLTIRRSMRHYGGQSIT
ncbi:MAG: glycosyltransferase [Fidelibacterota bacterium]|nr:MAG: glycosyltransferase [Candidatus Neomarinimicrobiota bacterium]